MRKVKKIPFRDQQVYERERERETERENFEVSRDCGAKLWIISSYVEPNNSLYTHTHKKMNTWGKIENF